MNCNAQILFGPNSFLLGGWEGKEHCKNNCKVAVYNTLVVYIMCVGGKALDTCSILRIVASYTNCYIYVECSITSSSL